MKTNSNSRTLAFNDWVRRLVRCYDEELSDAEREELHEWESHPDFPEIGYWPGWIDHIGACPTGPNADASPVPLRRPA